MLGFKPKYGSHAGTNHAVLGANHKVLGPPLPHGLGSRRARAQPGRALS